VGFAALTALGAFVRIPLSFTPVPITMQTFFVNLAGAVLGPGLGSAAEVLYVAVGVAGIPIFAGAHSGFARLVGPTGGYLIAFMIVPLVIGRLVRLRANPGYWWIVLCMVCGSIITFAVGATQLALFLGTGPVDAIVKGVLPFLPGDSLKIAVGAGLYRAIGARTRQIYD
jgi:biotin transport system substrate-specific component